MNTASKVIQLCVDVNEGRTLPTAAQIEAELLKLNQFFTDVSLSEDVVQASLKPAQVLSFRKRIYSNVVLTHAFVGIEDNIATFESCHDGAKKAAAEAAEEHEEED